MKKQKILKGLIIGVCVLTLAGCGTKQSEIQEKDMPVTGQYQNDISDAEDMSLDKDEKDSDAPETDNADDNGSQEKVDADSLYVSAAVTGSVVDFSDGSCTVSAAVTEDDGDGLTVAMAAPGYESEDTNVVVTYQEGCVVQIATIYTSTGIAELKQASADDIKKEASVIIYGSFEDTHHVTASKIIICDRTA